MTRTNESWKPRMLHAAQHAIKADGSIQYYFANGWVDRAYLRDAGAVKSMERVTREDIERRAKADGADLLTEIEYTWIDPGQSGYVDMRADEAHSGETVE